MPGPMDTAPCADCGEVVTTQRRYVKGGGRRDHLCTPCAIARSVANMVEISEHAGPGYDRWRDRMREAIARL